ncbi:catechol 2,3-dioxygenase [Arthrobacter sp. SLBN-100]|uniref:VOC family protein n=1 Tax=Arthrobacter sp. SLBN-100 TaxID=2768450 RepID=UPI00114D6688|nr:VOC family protein [Arthrobacter sp. SLBN-100]TQJ62222.1 catechol 2,3-dioxygenase [Arthrobacter sp. SLBN-100]
MTLKHRGILRLGYVRLAVDDLDAARAFARDDLGLVEHRTGIDPDGVERSYLRTWREGYAFSYVLERGTPGLVEIGLQVREQDDLHEAADRVEQTGVTVDWAGQDKVLLDLGASISFTVPAGPQLRLYSEALVTGPVVGYNSPHWNVPKQLRATSAPMNLGHVGFTTPDTEAVVNFLTVVLDFGVSELITTDDGEQTLSALLFRSNYGQDLAIFPGSEPRLHHVAFLQYDDATILRDVTWMREAGAEIDLWGPTRQSYGRTMSVHFKDPCGIRYELFAGGRFSELHPAFQPVRWTESNLDKALSFYDSIDNPDFLKPCL